MAFDPWAQTNQGLSNLTNTLGTLAQLKRQNQQYADEAPDRAARRSLADLQLQGTQRKNTDELALRDALTNVQGKYLYPEPAGMGPVQPGQESALSGLGPAQQPVSAQDRMKVTAGLASQGNTAAQGQLPTMIDLDAKLAEMEMQTMARGGDRAGFLKKKADFEQGKEMIKTLSPLVSKAGEAGRGLAQKLLDGYKSFQPDNPIVQNMTLDDFSTKDDNLVVAIKDPTTGDVIGYNVLDPETSKSTFHFKPKEAPESKPFDRKYNDGDTEVTELYDASGKLTSTKKAPRYKLSAPAHGGGQGKPPFGYRFTANGDLEAIPGGPASPDGKQGGKILPAGQLESIADMKRVKDVLAEASDLLKSGKIDTGPVSGRLQSLGSKVGLASDAFVNLQQKMQTAENIMLKLRSGAAVTESEYQRFKKEFPRTSDTPEVRDRKMANAIGYASTLMDSKMDIYEEGGYRVPQSVRSGGKPVGKPAQKQAQGQTKKGGRFTIIEVK